ncbi:unnamed protein product [Caenorhabditis nigoni]
MCTESLTIFESHGKRSNKISISQNEMILKENLSVYLRSGPVFLLCSLTVSCNPWLFYPSLFIALLYNVIMYIFGFYLIYLSQSKDNYDYFV